MKVEVYKCDGCQREKGEANHWYVLQPAGQSVRLWHWDEEVHGEHFCGTQCLFKRLAQWAE